MSWTKKTAVAFGILAATAAGGAFADGAKQSGAPAAWQSVAKDAIPVVFQVDGADMLKSREKFRAGDKAIVSTVKKIVSEADEVLDTPPFSVVNKKGMPPSGDKHDYMSLSPYWWPDPSKPDGKPYIRKDGEFNPERADYDVDPLDKLSSATENLSLAYFFTGDEKYAQKCAELMRTWFIDPSTRMNPHLKYAQFVPGYDKPRPSGIIEGGRFRDVVDAAGYIAGSPHWSEEDQKAMQAWFKDLLTYITTSEQGKTELNQKNNHGTWAQVQTATYALFIGDEKQARKLLERYKTLIQDQIKPDGTQPEELVRTLSFHYSRFNLVALADLASMGERLGMDLWNYKTDDGKSMRTAIDYLLPYTLEEQPWPHQQIRPAKFSDMIPVLRRAANAYNEPKYELAAKKLQEKDSRVLVDLMYPSNVQ